jgi:hypothetical protein
MSGVIDLPCGCTMDDYSGLALYVCQACRERKKRQETSERDSVLQVGTSDGLDCPLCAKMGPKEVYEKWGFDYEARYKDTCKAHRPLMLERMEDGLNKLKELLAD